MRTTQQMSITLTNEMADNGSPAVPMRPSRK